uniref:Caprin-1_dimer domain-containing protein n=1 Tax=Mesocestoides corti TaxID=53468 RepID=A0A5K3F279_MESCO
MADGLVSPSDLMVEYASNLEKKQRNLMKRKARLETYREMLRKGESLTGDQEKAVAEYDSVCQLIEALKETSDILGEIQAKVDNAVKENEKYMEFLRVEHAVDIIQKLWPVLEVLSKIKSPAVKAAIVKVSSSRELSILENASKSLTVSLPQGVTVDEIESGDLFRQQAEYLYKLADGSQNSVGSRSNKSRSRTFAEIRKCCLNLLANEDVRSALSSLSADFAKKKTAPVNDQSKPIEVTDAPTVAVETVTQPEPQKVTMQSAMSFTDPLPAEAILDSVINPLKTDFNFLQASQVGPVSVVYDLSHPIARPPPHPVPPQQSSPQVSGATVPVSSHVPATTLHQSDTFDKRQEPVSVNVPEPQLVNHALTPPSEEMSTGAVNNGDSLVPVEPVVEKPKLKQKSRRGGANKVLKEHQQDQSRMAPLQNVIDAEVPQQQTGKHAEMTWADRVRGAATNQVNEVVPPSTGVQNGNNDPPPIRSQPTQHQEPRSHRPPRPTHSGGELNASRPGGRGFRGGGRGRGTGGMSYRGVRGRGHPRGSFHGRREYVENNGTVGSHAPIESQC